MTQDNRIAKAIADVFGRIDLEWLVPGRIVALKPNETWASVNDKTGVTQPDTLRAVLPRSEEKHQTPMARDFSRAICV